MVADLRPPGSNRVKKSENPTLGTSGDLLHSALTFYIPEKDQICDSRLSAKDDDFSRRTDSAAAVGVRPRFESTDQGRHVVGKQPEVGVLLLASYLHHMTSGALGSIQICA